MKKLYLLVIASLAVTFSQAQDITDATRYSTEMLSGTARFRALSGAFGALGGDLSALEINPAGSAIFLNSYATVTLDFANAKNETNYFNGYTSSKNSQVYLNQAGGVFVFNSVDPENNWQKFSLGLNYDQTNTLDDNFVAQGTGNTSIAQYFLKYANGVPLDLLQTRDNETVTELYKYLGENEGYGAQQAFLGYQGYIIDPASDDPNNTSYSTPVASGNFNQSYSHISSGLNGKFSFNFATEYKDFLYLGLNLNAHFLNYDRSVQLRESNSNSGAGSNTILFRNNLSTTGNGFSFQLGAIGKVNDFLRLGASYESPTWFTISEQASQTLATDGDQFGGSITVNPNVVNIYPDYTLQTPGKLTGSVALIFGDNGLLSFDYSYKDYSNTQFRPAKDPSFSNQNEIIASNLKATSSYRLGGEYRIENWSLRGGYRFEQSPYNTQNTIGDLNGFSAGLGYDFGNVKLDAAYDSSSRTDNPQLYQTGLTDSAQLKRDFSSVVVSLSFGI